MKNRKLFPLFICYFLKPGMSQNQRYMAIGLPNNAVRIRGVVFFFCFFFFIND